MRGAVVQSAIALVMALILLSNVLAGPADSPLQTDPTSLVPELPAHPLLDRLQPGGIDPSTQFETPYSTDDLPVRPAPHVPMDRDAVYAEHRNREDTTPSLPIQGLPTEGLVDCLPHPPIEIRGDQGAFGFVIAQIAGVPVYRPGSGVTSGTGTPEDPYVIEGWCIDPLPPLGERRGIEIRDTNAHVVIRDNQFRGFQWSAIDLDDAHHVTVQDNLFLDNERAIYGINSSRVVFEENRVEGIGGAILLGAHGAIVHGNQIDVTIEGVYVTGSIGASVTQNSVTSGPFGIWVSDSDNAIVQGNSVQADWFAINAQHTDDTTILDNQASGGDYGILLEYVNGAFVQGNTLTNNAHGILAWGYTDLMVKDNTITDNDVGAHIEHGERARIEGNHIKDNRDQGLYLVDNLSPRVTDNTIQDNTLTGILSFFQSDAEFSGNQIQGHRTGMAHLNQDGLTIMDNTVLDSNYMGIHTSSTLTTEIRGNHVQGNTFGIFTSQSSGLTIEGNTVIDTQWVAIHETEGISVTIRNNLIEGNEVPIWTSHSQDMLIEGNTVRNNDGSVIQAYTVQGLSVRENLILDEEDKPGARPTIRVYSSPGAVIEANTLQSPQPADHLYASRDQIELYGSENSVIRDNTLSSGGLTIFGDQLVHYENQVTGNTVDGRPVVYLHGESDAVIAPGAGQVILVESPRALIQGHTYQHTQIPVMLVNSDDVIIKGLTARNAEVAVFAFESHGLRLQDSLIEENWAGAFLYRSDNAQITGNRITQNQVGLILLSQGGQVHHNDLVENRYGIGLLDSQGISIEQNEIRDNAEGGVLITGETTGDQGGHILHENNIHGTGPDQTPGDVPAVWVDSVFTLDARFNWWGCSDGPSGPGCDKVEGDVDASEWRTSPVVDAGA